MQLRRGSLQQILVDYIRQYWNDLPENMSDEMRHRLLRTPITRNLFTVHRFYRLISEEEQKWNRITNDRHSHVIHSHIQ